VSSTFPTIEILGIPFARLDVASALDEVERLYNRDEPAMVAHVNVHTVNLASEDRAYRDVLRSADMVLNDGKGVMLAARLLGERFPIDLNGNFFSPLVLQRAVARNWKVYFLGAKPGVADHAAALLRAKIPGLEIVGVRDGHFSAAEEDAVVAEIRASGAGVVMVGMGNPLQERWLHRRLADTGARLGIGVGAFFDFQTGHVPRAPHWMQRLGIEWVHRLVKEPRRMWKRYLVGNPKFLARVLRSRRTLRNRG
jgi:exopolysaccharide biosynthesis WecB/TagA/CpsF family protein